MTTLATRLPHRAAEVAAALAKSTKGVSRKSRAVIRAINAPYHASSNRKLKSSLRAVKDRG